MQYEYDINWNTITNEELVDLIRKWEMDAGESFTDYFLDMYSYHDDDGWLLFLKEKGFTSLLAEIKDSCYTFKDGSVSLCTDQQLKFEPFSSAQEEWDEDVYRKDVALWAEFIRSSARVRGELETFFEEYFTEDV